MVADEGGTMLKKVKRYIRLYKVLIAQFFKVIIQSKVDFLMGLLGFFFTQFMGIAFLYLVFQQIPSLQGWTLDQLIFIYGFAQIPRGIDHLLTDNVWLVAWRLVINGDFDRYMLRPMNIFFQVIAEKLQPDALGELLIGYILVWISLSKGIVILDAAHVLLFVVSVLAGALIYTSIKLLYAKAIRFIITWVIPFAFVAYLPASFFLKHEVSAAVIGIECLIAVVFWCIAYAVFNHGTKVYESAGN